MTKRELIDQIRMLNPTARSEFLADFEEQDLRAYLQQLRELARERSWRLERAEMEPALVA
ncbi:MAG TPA: hypothetical protein PKY77_09035 [Phycisphaerae bacterium]|nr:hypothetical protein [Phycisphaerae bacterium]HRY68396.1 hypothetical protein [Phycisphaerae bacterium]HSA27813.1 hypothetical protein [Phycisphaerae bacterium]